MVLERLLQPVVSRFCNDVVLVTASPPEMLVVPSVVRPSAVIPESVRFPVRERFDPVAEVKFRLEMSAVLALIVPAMSEVRVETPDTISEDAVVVFRFVKPSAFKTPLIDKVVAVVVFKVVLPVLARSPVLSEYAEEVPILEVPRTVIV